MTYPLLTDTDISGKRVLLRAGCDLPIADGKVTDPSRIDALVPTMKYILDQGAKLIIMAHQGRPKGQVVPEMSQEPIVSVLQDRLGCTVHFSTTSSGPEAKKKAEELGEGEVLLLENLRFDPREKSKDSTERDAFGKELADLADVYVNDAFTNSHRDHASMTSTPKYLPSFMGLSLEQEVQNLTSVIEGQKRPLVLIISGVKMETKVPVIERFLQEGDDVLLGGGIANTFLAATGHSVHASKYEDEYAEKAKAMLEESVSDDCADIHVPQDVVTATELYEDAETNVVSADAIEEGTAIFDIGPETRNDYIAAIEKAEMVIWNGPIGVHEFAAFAEGTKAISQAVTAATARGATTILGGGDTIDFHNRYNLPLDAYTFVSMGGGAMLEFISGKKLPALEALKE